MNWADYWNALVDGDTFLGAGLALLIIGAIFRWFEPLNEFLERAASLVMAPPPLPRDDEGRRVEPIRFSTRAYAARLRAAGDEASARRAEERAEDHMRRLTRYGRAMMVAGVVLFLLGVWLQ
jgi:hypothetical protein